MHPVFRWLARATLATHVLANTEKAIFSGPVPINIPTQPPTLDTLGLNALSPDIPAVRLHVDAIFQDDTNPEGAATWLLLYNLTAAQQYELRICWAATQPTNFTLDTFEVDHVFDTPELITSLAVYSQRRQLSLTTQDEKAEPAARLLPPHGKEATLSVMFLRILAAADYHSDDPTRTANVEPVLVDIILDPYYLNIVPRSLLPTAVYIIAIAILAWIVSQAVQRWIQRALVPVGHLKKQH